MRASALPSPPCALHRRGPASSAQRAGDARAAGGRLAAGGWPSGDERPSATGGAASGRRPKRDRALANHAGAADAWAGRAAPAGTSTCGIFPISSPAHVTRTGLCAAAERHVRRRADGAEPPAELRPARIPPPLAATSLPAQSPSPARNLLSRHRPEHV
jgi:hypothetical protein